MPTLPADPVPVIVYTAGLLKNDHAKTCHGLLRGSARFRAVAVVDPEFSGQDAGVVMDGRERGVPVYATLAAYLGLSQNPPGVFVIGVAFSGGRLPDNCRGEIAEALRNGMTVVNGLHHLLGDDPEFKALVEAHKGTIVDIRRPRPTDQLRFWTGEVQSVGAVVIPVLGTDCAVGKRTTARFLMEACREAGLRAEMIYTGQTGWMQGSPYGFIFDATANDFVSGELEKALVECDQAARPDVIFIEGQSSLRNPSGPCGAEFIVSGNASGVILQHAPARTWFVDHEHTGHRVPSVPNEIALIRMYGAETIGVALNEEGVSLEKLKTYRDDLRRETGLPVAIPLSEGVADLLPAVLSCVKECKEKNRPSQAASR